MKLRGRLSKSLVFTLGLVLLATAPHTTADIIRGLENYLLILKGGKKIESLSTEETREVVEIHNRLKGIGSGGTGGGCNQVIESQIDGEFEGWEGETIFKLINGQMWQQSSYAYTYSYAYMPEVMIYPSGGTCNLKVEGVSETISVQRIR